MSLPDNSLYPTPIYYPFIADKGSRVSRTKDFEYGGIHYRDASLGLLHTIWIAEVVGNDVRVYNKQTDETYYVYSGTDITEISFGMDTAANPVIAVVDRGTCFIRWFDYSQQNYIVSTFYNIRNPCIGMDDKYNYITSNSSVIFAYVKDNKLYFRDQRDRFEVEYWLRDLTSNIKLIKVGMSEGRRFQFQLVDTNLL